MQPNQTVDVLIIGAGLSGISAAVHLKQRCPNKTFSIIEARAAMGGTWDLFRYPGIRSDSDMYTLGYSFKPWTDPEAIADGPAILQYINETAKEYDIDQSIVYNYKAIKANWSTTQSTWTITIQNSVDGTTTECTCNFLYACSGYYNYDHGYTPDFEGIDDYQGHFIHPQKWPNDLDYTGKNIVVIGSGATAVTLVPELAKKAKKVTMLQRSPTYMVSAPREDKVANLLRALLPAMWAYKIIRWKNINMSILVYNACKRWPKTMTKFLLKGVKKELENEEDLKKHFTPHYNPWEQRLCLVPEADIFEAIKANKAEIVTDHIERITSDSIQLKSGQSIVADIIVCATGLELQLLGGMTLTIDTQEKDASNLLCFRGLMLQDIPNMALAFGYTNASWTLKCDLSSEYVCRLLNHMDSIGTASCTPRLVDDHIEKVPFVDFSSGYFQRGIHQLPKQGTSGPWVVNQNYKKDIKSLRKSDLSEKELEYA